MGISVPPRLSDLPVFTTSLHLVFVPPLTNCICLLAATTAAHSRAPPWPGIALYFLYSLLFLLELGSLPLKVSCPSESCLSSKRRPRTVLGAVPRSLQGPLPHSLTSFPKLKQEQALPASEHAFLLERLPSLYNSLPTGNSFMGCSHVTPSSEAI